MPNTIHLSVGVPTNRNAISTYRLVSPPTEITLFIGWWGHQPIKLFSLKTNIYY